MSWSEVERRLAAQAPGAVLVVKRTGIETPAAAGAVLALGLPRGELRGWRFPPSITCSGLHVHEYADHYVAHLDQVHPACDLLGHVQADAPELLAVGTVGAFLGFLGGGGVRRPGRALVGAVVGAVLGAAAAGCLRPNPPPTPTGGPT